MSFNFFDLIYLLLVLTGIVILIENRLERILYLIALQGLLLVFPVFQVHSLGDFHAWTLVAMILIFKTTLTPYVLHWSVKKSKMSVHTQPRFGFLATFFFFIIGLIASLYSTNSLDCTYLRIYYDRERDFLTYTNFTKRSSFWY